MADIYVDYSASNDGNGTTAAQAGSPGGTGAYNTLASKIFTLGDKIWIRRITTSNQGSSLTLSQTGINYIGWPKTGDEWYATRPASGTSNGWDSDSNDQFIWKTNTSTIINTFSGDSNKIYRWKYQNDISPTVNSVVVSGNNNWFYNSYFFISVSTTSNITNFTLTGANNRFYNHTYSTTSLNGGANCRILSITGAGNKFFTLSILIGGATSASTGGIVDFSGLFTYLQDVAYTITGTFSSSSAILMNIPFKIIINNLAVTTTAATNAIYILATIGSTNSFIRGLSIDYIQTSAGDLLTVSGNNNRIWLTGPTETRNTNNVKMISFTGTAAYNTIYIKNLIRNNNNVNSNDISFASGAINNIVYADNCLFTSNPIIAFNGSVKNWLYSINHGQVSGYWKAINRAGILESSNTVRSGGETFSIRFEVLEQNTQSYETLEFGHLQETTTWISLTAGSRTITIYGAYKLFGSNPPTKSDLWVETEQKANDYTNNFVSTHDLNNAALESDSSTWSNDPSVTPFKITKTFTVDNTCVVPVRINYYKSVANGYVYIDPLIVVA